jgi:polar amino acid transport system substrate-binding protein
MRGLIVAFLIAGALAGHGAPAHAADLEPRAILAPTGVLRAALYTGTPTSMLPDPKAGGPRGVGYDLGKELAKRLAVPYEPVVFSKNADVLAAIKNGTAGISPWLGPWIASRTRRFKPPIPPCRGAKATAA